MEGEFVSADSKGLIGALNPLLCITFEVHKIGATLGILKSGPERRWTGREASRYCCDFTPPDSTKVGNCPYLVLSYYSNRGRRSGRGFGRIDGW